MPQCPFGHEEGSLPGCAFCGGAAPVATDGLPVPHYARQHGLKAFHQKVAEAVAVLKDLFPRGFVFLGEYPQIEDPRLTAYCARWYGDPHMGLGRAHRLASMIDHTLSAEEEDIGDDDDS